MNYNKTIKGLRELNSQLKGQYSDEQNRNYCLQCKIDKLEKEKQELIEDIKNLINIINNNCFELDTTKEEFESLKKWNK